MATVFKCDACGTIVDGYETAKVEVKIREFSNVFSVAGVGPTKNYDLCNPCADKVKAVLPL